MTKRPKDTSKEPATADLATTNLANGELATGDRPAVDAGEAASEPAATSDAKPDKEKAGKTKSDKPKSDKPKSGKAKSGNADSPAEKADAPKSGGAGGDTQVSQGSLVWYNERKGYGFVRIGEEEVFLHRSTLDRFGLVRLLTGDQLTVSLSSNEHGRVIKDLLSVERPLNPTPPAGAEPEDGEMRAVVKFFNDLRGYGFVTADHLDEDVFVHSRVLNDCGFHSLVQGQKLLVKVDNSARGLQVNSVRLLTE